MLLSLAVDGIQGPKRLQRLASMDLSSPQRESDVHWSGLLATRESKGLSMSSGDWIGTLVISIDLELDPDRHERQLERQLDLVRTELVTLTKEAAVPATWAVADPMLSAATDSILGAKCGHEIAVLGDQAWLGPGCGRERLSRELTRRFSVPRKAGIPVSTLALRNVEHVADLDLLLKHGVTAVCSVPVDDPSFARKREQSPLRFGVWQPPDARRLPPQTTWWSPAGWLIRREIKRAIRQRSLLHLRLDALRLIDAPCRSLDLVAAILRFAAAKRDAGQLAIKAISQLAAQALSSRAAHPSRSILQSAA